MDHNTFFLEQPPFTQLRKLIPAGLVQSCISKHQSNRYYKTFKSYDHLVSRLYNSLFKCTSLWEVCTGMQAYSSKRRHLRLKRTPRVGVLCLMLTGDGMNNSLLTSMQVFIIHYNNSSDCRANKNLESRLFIMDSTTIKLFTDVMKGAGAKPSAVSRKEEPRLMCC